MTNPTPHGQVPEALRIADEFKLCSEVDSIPSIIDIEKAEAELRRQHTRIAELEAQLEAIGAGGVSGPLMGIAAPPTAQAEGWQARTSDAAQAGAPVIPAMMYLMLTDAMGYDSGEDGTTWSPEEWAAHLYSFYKSKTAPAQPGQEGEPVAWLDPWTGVQVTTDYDAYGKYGIPLYTTPQPTQGQAGAVPLTDEQLAEMMRETWGCASIAPRHAIGFARAIERAHGIGIKGGQHG